MAEPGRCWLDATGTRRYRDLRKHTALWTLCATVGLMLLSAIAGAQVSDTNGTATVDVQPALSLTLVASPQWGKVTAPPSGTARYTLSYATGAVTLTSGNGYAFDNGQAGQYTVNG